MSDRAITSRLQALRIDVEPDVEERHITAMLRELREAPPSPTLARTPRRGARRRAVAIMVAAFAMLLPTAAIAAEDTVPGDLLYPVKRSTEWARSLVDPGVRQRHRVEELETVIERGAPVDVVTDRYEASVEAVDEGDGDLVRRMERARERARQQYGVDLQSVPRDTTDGATTDPGTTEDPADRPGRSEGPAVGSDSSTGPSSDSGSGRDDGASDDRASDGGPDQSGDRERSRDRTGDSGRSGP